MSLSDSGLNMNPLQNDHIGSLREEVSSPTHMFPIICVFILPHDVLGHGSLSSLSDIENRSEGLSPTVKHDSMNLHHITRLFSSPVCEMKAFLCRQISGILPALCLLKANVIRGDTDSRYTS
ncbi:hypothetical protein Q8A73_010556 [Channa argus]|nr:hypothetical protein Q8A73_010556 [Channa argus]